MSERKKPVWPWIVTCVVMLPVSYVLSFGPACWISAYPNRGFPGGPLTKTPHAMIVYWPLGWAAESKPAIAGPVLRWWACLGMESGHMLWVPAAQNKTNWHAFHKL